MHTLLGPKTSRDDIVLSCRGMAKRGVMVVDDLLDFGNFAYAQKLKTSGSSSATNSTDFQALGNFLKGLLGFVRGLD